MGSSRERENVGFGFYNYHVVVQRAQTLKYPLALIHLSKSSALPRTLGSWTRSSCEIDQIAYYLICFSSVGEHIGTHRDGVSRRRLTILFHNALQLHRYPVSTPLFRSWAIFRSML